METDRLRYFCLIAESGSLTKAAEILGISHSGLSKAMASLQEELGDQILRPHGRGLEITEAGKVFYQKSKEILDLVERLKDQDELKKKLFLRIGLAEIFSISIANAIAKEIPQEIDFYEMDSGEAEVQILEGSVDFALSFVPFPHQDLEYLKIKKSHMGVFHLNPNFDKCPLEELPFVVPNVEIKNNPLSIKSRDGWPVGIKRKIAFGSNTLSMALEIAESGNAVIFIPQFSIRQLNLRRIPNAQWIEYEIKKSDFQNAARDIYLIKRKNVEESKEMKVVAKVVRKLC